MDFKKEFRELELKYDSLLKEYNDLYRQYLEFDHNAESAMNLLLGEEEGNIAKLEVKLSTLKLEVSTLGIIKQLTQNQERK